MFKRKKKKNDIMEKAMGIAGEMRSPLTDPNGSYTGAPNAKSETPVQDADDI